MAELHSRLIIATPEAFVCDGEQKVYNWLNDEGCDIKVRASMVWGGMSKGQISDFGLHLFRMSDAEYINPFGWDHYIDPTTLHQQYIPFPGNDYMLIKASDGIRLIAFATSENQPPLFGGACIWIWFTRGRQVTGARKRKAGKANADVDLFMQVVKAKKR